MSSYSFSSTSYSSSSSTSNGQTTSNSYATQQYSDPRGTTVRQTTQNSGEPTVQETRYYDNSGRELPANATGGRLEDQTRGGGAAYTQGRIEDVDERENGYRSPQTGETEADQKYREAMEDEYAKREGGA